MAGHNIFMISLYLAKLIVHVEMPSKEYTIMLMGDRSKLANMILFISLLKY